MSAPVDEKPTTTRTSSSPSPPSSSHIHNPTIDEDEKKQDHHHTDEDIKQPKKRWGRKPKDEVAVEVDKPAVEETLPPIAFRELFRYSTRGEMILNFCGLVASGE